MQDTAGRANGRIQVPRLTLLGNEEPQQLLRIRLLREQLGDLTFREVQPIETKSELGIGHMVVATCLWVRQQHLVIHHPLRQPCLAAVLSCPTQDIGIARRELQGRTQALAGGGGRIPTPPKLFRGPGVTASSNHLYRSVGQFCHAGQGQEDPQKQDDAADPDRRVGENPGNFDHAHAPPRPRGATIGGRLGIHGRENLRKVGQ